MAFVKKKNQSFHRKTGSSYTLAGIKSSTPYLLPCLDLSNAVQSYLPWKTTNFIADVWLKILFFFKFLKQISLRRLYNMVYESSLMTDTLQDRNFVTTVKINLSQCWIFWNLLQNRSIFNVQLRTVKMIFNYKNSCFVRTFTYGHTKINVLTLRFHDQGLMIDEMIAWRVWVCYTFDILCLAHAFWD